MHLALPFQPTIYKTGQQIEKHTASFSIQDASLSVIRLPSEVRYHVRAAGIKSEKARTGYDPISAIADLLHILL